MGTETTNRIDNAIKNIKAQKDIFKGLLLEDITSNEFFAHMVEEVAKSASQTSTSIWSIIKDTVDSPLEAIQKTMGMYFGSVKDAPKNYLYYFAIRTLRDKVDKRIQICNRILNCLKQLQTLYTTNVLIRISPSIRREFQTVLGYLISAKNEVESSFIRTDTILKNKNPGDFLRIKNAQKYIEDAQNYIVSLKNKKNISIKEKEFLLRLEEYIRTNWAILSELSTLLPFLDLGALPNFVISAISNPTGIITQNDSTLRSLNITIKNTKANIKGFDTNLEKFRVQHNSAFLGKIFRFYSPELNKLIADMQTTEYPNTLAEFLVRAPAWYARMEYIKDTLYLAKIDIEDHSGNTGNTAAVNASLSALSDDSSAEELYNELMSRFPALIKTTYVGNIMENKNVVPSLGRLLSLCQEVISSDSELLRLIKSIQTTTEYSLFELKLDIGLNALGTLSTFAEATPIIIDSIRNGNFLSIPIVASVEGYKNALKSLLEYTTNADIIFDPDNLLAEKNLFAPSTHYETISDMSSIMLDSYTELFTTIKNHLENL